MSACGWKSQFGKKEEERNLSQEEVEGRLLCVCVFLGLSSWFFNQLHIYTTVHILCLFFSIRFFSFTLGRFCCLPSAISTGWLQMVWAISRDFTLHSSVDILLLFLFLSSFFTALTAAFVLCPMTFGCYHHFSLDWWSYFSFFLGANVFPVWLDWRIVPEAIAQTTNDR